MLVTSWTVTRKDKTPAIWVLGAEGGCCGSRKITLHNLSHPWPSLEVEFRSQVPCPSHLHPCPDHPLHVLLSQQPQYTIIATTVALQVKHQPTFYYPHTRADEKERNSTKENKRKGKWELL